MQLYPSHCLMTRSGLLFDYADPQPEAIELSEICWSLAGKERWCGHLKFSFTVAHHLLLCAKLAESLESPINNIIGCLTHDFAEAYTGDIPAPLKSLIPGFVQIEDRIERAIRIALKLPDYDDEFVHQIDMWVREFEFMAIQKTMIDLAAYVLRVDDKCTQPVRAGLAMALKSRFETLMQLHK